MARERLSIFYLMILVGTAPRGAEDIMDLEKSSSAKPLGDLSLPGYAVLQKIFFAPTGGSGVHLRAGDGSDSDGGVP